MKVCNKIIAFILAFAIAFSLVVAYPVTAHASASGSVLTDSASVTAWNSYFDTKYILGSATSVEGISISASIAKSKLWANFDSALSDVGLGSMATYDKLQNAASKFGSRLKYHDTSLFSSAYTVLLGRPVPTATVAYDSSLGVYRLKDNYSGLWLVNSAGHFPYYKETANTEDDGSSPTLTYSWWLKTDTTGISVQVLPQDDLKTIAKRYDGYVRQVGEYYMIVDVTGSKYLCASGGHRLAAIVDLDQTAVDQTNNYYTQEGDTVYNEYQGGDTIINEGDTIIHEGDTITNNSTTVYEGGDTYNNQFIDIEDNSIHLQDGSIYNIDNLYYDESTQSYYVDSHDSYTYNSTTNEYVTNNYTFRIQYEIHYTSITYIGQTEEYEADTYVYYYELPDGRSSADLTAEELEQLSLAFTDVVNYARSTDDAYMRVLYHFDGNTEDSSYWSYCTEFDWSTGASLTYMDEGTFGGSLYLDETEHEFSITLPNSGDASQDWTLQFRYYQSYTAAPVEDSYISVGGTKIAVFDGAAFRNYNGNVALAQMSVGAWNEICIVCVDQCLSYYFNGVYLVTTSSTFSFPSSDLLFHFGTEQQTYKKLDELRFTRGAVYTPGEDYTPSAVPHDTNLSLILPDGERPLADEVMILTPAANNLLTAKKLDDWSVSTAAENLKKYARVSNAPDFETRFSGGPSLFYNADYTTVLPGSGFTSLSSSGTSATATTGTSGMGSYKFTDLANGLFLPLVGQYHLNSSCTSSYSTFYSSFGSADTTYTFSVVLSDGTYSSITFTPKKSSSTYSVSVSSTLNGSCMTLSSVVYDAVSDYYLSFNDTYYHYHYRYFGIAMVPTSGSTADIVYMELVEGSEPGFTIDWEFAMYSSGELEESPVLAVRSNTPISTYTFGGVRPTYPERGQVWAMVEGHRIVSLQQYTGSAWVEVDGRIWTGKRWIPYSSFDVFTLQDCWDVVDSGESDDFEYIYSEIGFWNWLQKAWLEMLQKLDAIIIALGGDPDALPGDSPGDDSDLTFWERVRKIFEDSLAKILESLLELITNILDLVLGVVYDLLDFFFGLLTDAVTNGIGGFFEALMDETLLQFFQSEEPVLDENGEPVVDENGDPVTVKVVALPAGVAGVFAFISAAIMVLPDDLRFVLFFGIGALFLLAVLKLVRS